MLHRTSKRRPLCPIINPFVQSLPRLCPRLDRERIRRTRLRYTFGPSPNARIALEVIKAENQTWLRNIKKVAIFNYIPQA
jgi:hypothetical protein